ncbi:MAG: hypothetical protein QGG38_07250 [Nitrospinaceae bacterium]|jgi:hypothetical protein|nr:hypothetical protein [Nitrospinaceae bacterium]MDP6712466.1 hypothetical protein [Nitrospinaceae bacterium]MDP7057603.1 hypothetical protein [Nitrospinaceae bacterium]HAK37276.1 hypothetical protein [Nitrospina sp.]|tara:strand:+ start:2079 stop:2960 length:882 start_codon:yes stop_codon:yes gene_type:complete
MLAFSKNITQKNLSHPEESNNSELKEYMDYQRALNHERLIYHALNHAKTDLTNSINEFENDQEKLDKYIKDSFPVSSGSLKRAATIIFMLRKLLNGHNSSNNWYRMNTYYHALVYDCMKIFVTFYNELVQKAPEKADDLKISGGVEVDFDDWAHLYFPDMDFHIGKELEGSHYPFAKRNKAIEESISKEISEGKSFEEALQEIKGKYEIEDVSINFLLNNEIEKQDMELFYTSAENPIYEYLTEREDGSWGAVDGESLLDQAYYLGSTLKVWVWRKKEDVATAMEDMSNIIKK